MAKVATTQESLTIPFSSIEVDQEFNCRSSYEDIEELTESIHSQGLITPLTVMANGVKGTYRLVSGFRRYQALRNLKTGEKPINVVVRKFESDSQLHLANLVENTARDAVHPADLAERLAELEAGTYRRMLGTPVAEGEEVTVGEKVERKEIAKHTGLSAAHIGNLIRVHQKLSDPVKKMWRKHEIPMSKIFKWAPLDEEAQLEEFGSWKEQQDLEKSEGKKKRAKPSEESEEAQDSDEAEAAETNGNGNTFNGPSKSEMRSQMESLAEKFEKLKGAELDIAKAKHKTLRWVLGEITRL